MTHHEFITNSMIRGYHFLRTIWDAVIGERLQCVRKVSNVEDRYAQAICRGDTVVGHNYNTKDFHIVFFVYKAW